MTLQPRDAVTDIPDYIPGEATAEGASQIIKLSSNESPLGASPLAMKALTDTTPLTHLYPDAHAEELRTALAQKHGIPFDQIACGCGSEELLHLVARAYVNPGDEVIVSQYGFIGHHIAAMAAGGTLIKTPETDHHVDLGAMLDAVTHKTKLIYVANPGNPTGTMLPSSAIKSFHSELPPSVLLVIDAAYAEFADGLDGYESGFSLVEAGAPNVFVTRTFSKMHGLAALRIGWGFGAKEIVSYINRVRPAFNANALAQAAAIAALHDDNFVRESRQLNDQGLIQLTQGLENLGLAVSPSVCNFVLVHFNADAGPTASDIFAGLLKYGVIVRPVAGYGLPNSLRVTVGTESQNGVFLEAMKELLAARH